MELTGLVMIAMMALGDSLATTVARSRTIEALVLNRSSRVIPGLRGTPAGITTRSAPGGISPNKYYIMEVYIIRISSPPLLE